MADLPKKLSVRAVFADGCRTCRFCQSLRKVQSASWFVCENLSNDGKKQQHTITASTYENHIPEIAVIGAAVREGGRDGAGYSEPFQTEFGAHRECTFGVG